MLLFLSLMVCLLGLQVVLFPLQASGSGLGNKPDLASPVFDLPMLRRVVEFDVGGPCDLQAAEFM
jgi:hypothetical protein